MTFSYGQDFYNDLLKYSDHHSKDDQKAIEIAYELQSRLQNYWKNNAFEALKKSEKYSGNVDLNGHKSALGGDLNPFISGINNAPSTPAEASEFPFWSLNDKGNIINTKKNNTQSNMQINNNNNNNNNKEYLTDTGKNSDDGKNDQIYIWIMGIIIIFIFSIILGCCALNKN